MMNEQNGLPELPKGWTLAQLSEVTESAIEQDSPKNSESFRYVDISSIDNKSKRIVEPKTLLTSEAPSRAKQHLKSQDVLVSMTRPNLNAVAILPDELSNAIGSTGFCILRASEIEPLLLYYIVQTEFFVSAMVFLVQGALHPAVRPKDILSFIFPLPPLNEQARIVAKIEELFTKLDAGIEALKQIQKQIKRYRQAVLRDAVTGELTKAWREENRAEIEPATALLKRILDERRTRWEQEQQKKFTESGKTPKNDDWKKKYKEPAAPETENLDELPNIWVWTFTQQLGEIQLGRQRSPKNRSDKFPTKYIRAANITEDGLKLDDVLDMDFKPIEVERYKLKKDDLILSEASGSPSQVGKPAIWKNELPLCCFQNTVIRLRPNQNLSAKFLLLTFKTYYVNGIFSKIAGGVGINHLSADKFSTITVALPPLAEQQKIVEEVERLLSVADAIEQTVGQSLKQATRLRQSILKRAFEGKLVPQDDADEPASILLERIKQEREEQIKAVKKKKVKTRKKKTSAQNLSLFE